MKPSFTLREQQVIEQLLQGKSNKEIALALNLSVRAVEFHLSNLYAKLGVSSRTEAVLQLSALRESTSADLRTSTASEPGHSSENGEKTIPHRRQPMKKLIPLLIGTTLLFSALVWALLRPAPPVASSAFQSASPSVLSASPSAPTSAPPSAPPSVFPSAFPSASPSAPPSASQTLLTQIERLAAEYEQAVQAEKRTGQVEIVSEEVFVFKEQSYERISELYWQFMERKTQIERDYAQILRAEIHPTPFPTPIDENDRQAQYEQWVQEWGDQLCSIEAWQKDLTARSLSVYDPDEGKYRSLYYGEVVTRCEIFGQMLEEYRLAPWLERLNQPRDIALIRQVMGNPSLALTFQTIDSLANAPSYQAAIYVDETGARYGVEINSGVFALLQPNYPTHPVIPESDRKTMDELRGAARQFALTLSPRLREMERELLFEESCKGEICFFRWDARNRDWSGTDWALMPPLLQVGMLTNGQVSTLVNTLDLFTP